MVDVLHTVDQGVASHIIGNIFSSSQFIEHAWVVGLTQTGQQNWPNA
jgi:hypothetical protein